MDAEINTWFNSWDRLQSIAQGAVFFFIFIIVMVRLIGKRVTSELNNFDWILNVAVGGLAASGILLKEVSIADSATAIAIIMALQWLTTWTITRFPYMKKVVLAEPRLLLHKGKFIESALAAERISKSEVKATLRNSGYLSLDEANWVILESNGSLTVIPRQEADWSDTEIMGDVETPKRFPDPEL